MLVAICGEMGEGMASYLARDLSEGTKDVEDYERYCYYVAGLVGKGLSRRGWWSAPSPRPAARASPCLPKAPAAPDQTHPRAPPGHLADSPRPQ